MKKKSDQIYLFMGIGMFVVTSIIFLILECTTEYPSSIEDLFFTVGCLSVFLIVILSAYYCSKLFNNQFLEEYISLRWGKFIYRKILYDEIRVIVIMAAVDAHFCTIYDSSGKPMAALSLHKSEYLFLSAMFPNGFSIMPPDILNPDIIHKNILGCVFFDVSSFKTLMKKTEVPIFITQEMLSLYKDELRALFSECPERVRVSCYVDGSKKHQIVPYSQLNI